VDRAEQYYQLAARGRDPFLASAAPAALVRKRTRDAKLAAASALAQSLEEAAATLGGELDLRNLELSVELGTAPVSAAAAYEVYPVTKKPGAPFAEMITLGRTNNNDIVLDHVTISRFHLYFRKRGEVWVVADAGSKNGSALGDQPMEARHEYDLRSGMQIKIGEVQTTFLASDELYQLLVG
jgi:hypothetical protein